MRVYIAGALSSKENDTRNPSQVVVDYLNNVHKMCGAGREVRKLGHAPFVPAYDMLMGVANGDTSEQDYRGCSDEFLKVCDAVLVISMSWGVKGEIKLAESLNIPVCYSLQELSRL
jgi:7-cyano-7-deazaguanine synthase in queuosine biosynthesis